MRSILLFLFLIALTFTLQSQDRKGQIWVDGNSSVYLNGQNGLINASGGYFFTDRLLVGSGILAGEGTFTLSPFARYYFSGLDKKWRPYAEAGFGFSFVNSGGFNQVGAAAGVERTFGESALFNAELSFSNTGRNLGFNQTSLNANLNTTIGGLSGSAAAIGRFKKGNFTLGSQLLNASLFRGGGLDINSVSISPSVGYFLTDRLQAMVGLSLGYSQVSFENSQQETQTQDVFGLELAAGARYYLATERGLNWFVEGGLEFDYQNRKVDGATFTLDFLRARVGAGASIFISENASFDFGGYLYQGLSDGGTTGVLEGGLNFWFGN